MTQLAPLALDDDTVIYIEVTDDVDNIPADTSSLPGETTRTAKGVGEEVVRNFEAMQSTIRAYTSYSLDAFTKMAGANIDKVTLEFGVKVAGEAGVPYVTKGTADVNLKITVQCSFPKEAEAPALGTSPDQAA